MRFCPNWAQAQPAGHMGPNCGAQQSIHTKGRRSPLAPRPSEHSRVYENRMTFFSFSGIAKQKQQICFKGTQLLNIYMRLTPETATKSFLPAERAARNINLV